VQESKAAYFERKLGEYDAWRTQVDGRKWNSYKDEWYTTEQQFLYAGMDEFLDWLKDNE
jgi:hypothetical protein